ncbi:hypothetical protein Plec18170_001173 [Paecilomyces lecythidis]
MLNSASLLCVGLVAVVVYIAGGYLRDPKHLRRFPAPSVAAFTHFWLAYKISTGQRFKVVHAAHQKLGHAVRISPDHISFTYPDSVKEIYGHGSPNLKGDFFEHTGEGNPSMSQTTNKAEHTRKRKALAHVFAAKQITLMEPRVLQIVGKLCRDIHIKSQDQQVSGEDEYSSVDGIFDVRPWLNMFAYDAISSMFWSKSYGFLDKGNDRCSSRAESGATKEVHAMDSYHSISTFNGIYASMPTHWYKLAKVLLAWTHNRKALQSFAGMARYQVTERLKVIPPVDDLFARLPTEPSPKWPDPMPLSELITESATMLDAGNDTTQTSLANCIYRLAKHPEKQKKLHTALVKAIPEWDSMPAFTYSETLRHIPYLRAVLDESFRVQPPIASGLPRKVVEPITVSGHYIHPGTTISVPLYSLHRDESLFKDANNFIPERFLKDDNPDRDGFVTDPQEVQNLKDYCVPFSVGGRACIGRNLAYMELSMVIAALVLGFEWELPDSTHELRMIERFNCNPKELKIRAQPRDGIRWADFKA